jgi:thioesterase domain-containing protein
MTSADEELESRWRGRCASFLGTVDLYKERAGKASLARSRWSAFTWLATLVYLVATQVTSLLLKLLGLSGGAKWGGRRLSSALASTLALARLRFLTWYDSISMEEGVSYTLALDNG